MDAQRQTLAEMIDQVRDIPIYRPSIEAGSFPILEKPEIARGFPDSWMTPALAEALQAGEAELVLSTGTHHARMQIIRPPFFLLRSYYRLWSEHPDIAGTWREGCQRVSITTVLATEHVARLSARRRGVEAPAIPSLEERRLDPRTLYLNLRLDPSLWDRDDVGRMLDEMAAVEAAHPRRLYHLDCDSYHLAHLVRKALAWGAWQRFPRPASIIHAYEYTPRNVRRFLQQRFACPIVDLFGSTELGYLYYSDRHGRYWPYLDRMHLELLPVEEGSTIYSLIVSSVRNPYMPLIRYRSGDCAETVDGSPDPLRIRRFCGRERELLRLARGGLISQAHLDDWISAVAPSIFIYQLHPEEQQQARLLYTTFDDGPLDPATARALRQSILEGAGLDCALEHRAHIAIGKSGKYAWLVQDGQNAERGDP
jgi:phenylacetate-CoA ligase